MPEVTKPQFFFVNRVYFVCFSHPAILEGQSFLNHSIIYIYIYYIMYIYIYDYICMLYARAFVQIHICIYIN